MSDPTETFWEEILSRQHERILMAFRSLSTDEKAAVLNHLKRMITESGWHPEQIESASRALEALNDEQ